MINFTKYPVQTLYTTLKATPKYRDALKEKSWGQVMKVIKLLDINYTNEQLQYVKDQDWNVELNNNKDV